MTENEAIEILKYYDKQPYFFSRDASADYAFKMAIQALEEIQQYRAIGTIEKLQGWAEELKEARKGFNENRKAGYKHGYSDAITEFAERLSREFLRNDEDGNLYIFAWLTDFREIAEEMKVGGE